jgi:predicted molibdopterin-dependent oxidoreductase YjgC
MPLMVLNGREVEFQFGQSLLQVAAACGVAIPTLCHLPEADHKGVCRLCVVELEGWDRLLPSCDTPANEGMRVWTASAKVVAARRSILAMLVASGQHTCVEKQPPENQRSAAMAAALARPWHQAPCPADGNCRLQELVKAYGVDTDALTPEEANFPLDDTTPLIVRDFSRCILCGRCVAACQKVQVNGAIPVPFGRLQNRPQGWFPLADHDRCVHCGQCVQACPVGALFDKKAFGLSGAERKVATTCPYCGVGCQIQLHVKQAKVVKVTAAAAKPPNHGRLCVKGRYAYDFIHSPERLTTPLIRDAAGLRPACWDEALDVVAERFTAIRRARGADHLAGLTSARVTNEENYLMQKLVRTGFGTNAVDHCARL